MMSVPSRSTTGRSRGEIQRHDRDVLAVDVEPDVELGPVREREHAHALALAACARCRAATAPAAGASGSQRCCALRNEKMRSLARDFSSSRRAPPNAGIEAVLVERLAQRLRLHHVGVDFRAVRDRPDAARDAVRVGVDDQVEAELAARAGRGTRSSRGISRSYRRAAAGTAACRIKRLQRQMQQHRRILADRIEQHRVFGSRPRPRAGCGCSPPRGCWRCVSRSAHAPAGPKAEWRLRAAMHGTGSSVLRMQRRSTQPVAWTCRPHSFLSSLLPPPAAGALRLAEPHRAGAGRAADRGEAAVVQRVVGNRVVGARNRRGRCRASSRRAD